MANYKKIASVSVTGSSTSSIVFSSISSIYKHLILISSSRATGATDWFKAKLNNTGTYDARYWYADGSNAYCDLQASQSFPLANPLADPTQLMSDLFSYGEMVIPNYSNTSTNKVMLNTGGEGGQGTAQDQRLAQWDISSNISSAITQIEIQSQAANNFAVGTVFTLYGLES